MKINQKGVGWGCEGGVLQSGERNTMLTSEGKDTEHGASSQEISWQCGRMWEVLSEEWDKLPRHLSSGHDCFDFLSRPLYKIDYMIQCFPLLSTTDIGKAIKIRCVTGLKRLWLPSWHRLKPVVPSGKNVTSGYCLGPSLLSANHDLYDTGHQNGGHTWAYWCLPTVHTRTTGKMTWWLLFFPLLSSSTTSSYCSCCWGRSHLLTSKALVWILSSIILHAFFIML